MKLTVAGTVLALHQIPFSICPTNIETYHLSIGKDKAVFSTKANFGFLETGGRNFFSRYFRTFVPKTNAKLMQQFSRFLIGAASSGSGKTTLTLGLLKMLKNRNFNVQPFKCGPDYIDTKFHRMASENDAVNLDLYLSSAQHVKQLYAKYGAGKDACIIEGVMGLFDGYERQQGSSAQVARLLDAPVVLVINAKAMAYSAAPLLYGFKNFCPDVRLAGAIFNFVGSENHYKLLKEACAAVGVEPLGYLPKQQDIELSSRYLGLSFDNQQQLNAAIDNAAQLVEQHVEVDKLLALTATNPPQLPPNKAFSSGSLKIAVANDEAFTFTYTENIAALEQLGEVVFFSPMHDNRLPTADLIYLPGGYPELYLPQLSGNTEMLNAIRTYVENGGKLLAECGGMMYLSETIKDRHGVEYPVVGIFGQKASMCGSRLTLGYRTFEYNGVRVRGHEFHYSHIEENNIASVAKIYNARGDEVSTKLLRYKNTIAGYTHAYWAEVDLMRWFGE